ncbi:MAG: hypothetical protein DCF25_15610 [Leptolyngbya foveolarum]|uniref:Uncharacterized protein n=1 Tax=Leptolyngbya foveolarum TaxID=47253 RepID=A0A2W4U3V0_9CYAN|nr:MAG: hypothetical protein DCF25_15610 [Leptolyngbya foveolarum]
MASVAQQLSTFISQLEQLRDAIPVDPATTAVTLEKHSPGNGSTYTRLRVPKDKALANGKRTMSLDAKGIAEWEQKLYARNQQTKVAQCLALVQQAAEVAVSITWEAETKTAMVNESKVFTIDQTEYVVPGAIAPQPKAVIKYVLKDAKGATPINRTVHAISEDEPGYGRWYSSALCGERPKAGGLGWRRVDKSELSCPKCHEKLKSSR